MHKKLNDHSVKSFENSRFSTAVLFNSMAFRWRTVGPEVPFVFSVPNKVPDSNAATLDSVLIINSWIISSGTFFRELTLFLSFSLCLSRRATFTERTSLLAEAHKHNCVEILIVHGAFIDACSSRFYRWIF